MFLPHQSDHGLKPWEYLPAAAGTYQVGQLLKVADGQLAAIDAASTTTPPYLCMASKTVEANGILPVLPVAHDMIFQTECASADVKIGAKLQVAAGGLVADAAAAGTFEVTGVDAAEEGTVLLGRFK